LEKRVAKKVAISAGFLWEEIAEAQPFGIICRIGIG
jgi:hypothetical protein